MRSDPVLIRVAAALLLAALLTAPVGAGLDVRFPSLRDFPALEWVGSSARGLTEQAPMGLSALDQPQWRNLTGGAAPPATPGVIAQEPGGRGVLWWGALGGTALTWEWRVNGWVNVTSIAGAEPPVVSGPSLITDPVEGGVVWVGSPASSGCETWLFSNGTWKNETTNVSGAPSARSYAAGAWNPTAGEVVLFGGWNGSAYLGDTWTLAIGGWNALAAAGPSPRAGAGLASDPSIGGLLLVGGGTALGTVNDSWVFANGSWSGPLAGPPVGAGEGPSLTAAVGGAVIGVGGVGCNLPLIGPCNRTYSFSSGAWVEFNSGFGPSPRTGLALAYDGSGGSLLAWGGNRGSARLNDTWALGGPMSVVVVARPPAVGEDEVAEFAGRSSGGYGTTSFAWTGGPPDCPSANASVIVCLSEIPGTYSVTLTAHDLLGNSSTGTTPFTVLPRFASTLTVTPSVTDTGQNVSFNVTVVGGAAVVNYTWSGLPPGCPNSFQPTLVCAPLAPGFFTVVATVTDALGHVAPSAPTGLFVHERPVVAVTMNLSGGLAPLAVGFAADVVGGTAPFLFSWDFGDNSTSSTANPTHIYASAGAFPVGVRISDAVNVSVASAAGPMIRVADPLLVGLPQASSAARAGSPVVVTVNVSGGAPPYVFLWAFGDGFTSSAVTPSHTYATGGNYSLTVIVTDSGGQRSTAIASVQVAPAAGGSGLAGALTDPGLVGFGVVVGLGAAYVLLRRRGAHATDPPGERD